MTTVENSFTVSATDSSGSMGLNPSTGLRQWSSGGAGVVLDKHVARRTMTVVGLSGIALIHVLNLSTTMQELPYMGWLFIGLIVSSLVIAEGLMRTDDLRLWLAAGALNASLIIGYAISRTAGLPGDGGGDKGNWLEPLGLATLVIAGIVVLLSVARLTARRS